MRLFSAILFTTLILSDRPLPELQKEPSRSIASQRCDQVFAHPKKNKRSKVWIKDKVSLLWFPWFPGDTPGCSHTKISVNGQVYNYGANQQGRLESFERMSTLSLRKSFYEFQFRVTPDELKRLERYLKQGAKPGMSCVSSSCATLRKGARIFIPPPFDWLPSLNAFYLAAMRLKSYVHEGRVVSIRYHGNSEVRSLLSLDTALDWVIPGYIALMSFILSIELRPDRPTVPPSLETEAKEPRPVSVEDILELEPTVDSWQESLSFPEDR